MSVGGWVVRWLKERSFGVIAIGSERFSRQRPITTEPPNHRPIMSTLSDLLDEVTAFREYLRAERGMAENTVVAYGHDLERYAAWAADGRMREFRSPTLGELADYIGHMREEGLAPASVA